MKILRKNHPDSPHSDPHSPLSHPDSLHSHLDSPRFYPDFLRSTLILQVFDTEGKTWWENRKYPKNNINASFKLVLHYTFD